MLMNISKNSDAYRAYMDWVAEALTAPPELDKYEVFISARNRALWGLPRCRFDGNGDVGYQFPDGTVVRADFGLSFSRGLVDET